MLAVCDPEICQQVALDHNIKKHPGIAHFLRHLTGPDDMVSADGEVWKRWRTMFNPGFATQHLMTLVPGIVTDAEIFVSKLDAHADAQDVFKLEEVTTRLTIDVIGKVALDLHFNMQNGENECITAFREQAHLLPNGLHPLEMWNPWGIWRRFCNERIMVNYIGKVLDDRFAQRLNQSKDQSGLIKHKSRTVLDLALDSYLSTSSPTPDTKTSPLQHAPPPAISQTFKSGLTTQIRTFIFAGHDTTSSTLCYAFHLLSKHPSALQRIRSEHDLIFGQDPSLTASKIKSNPHILHKLDYTLAVLKETLRLYPAASAPRAGSPDTILRDPKTGTAFPTEGYMIWLVHHAVQRNEEVWGPTAHVFDPERFMPTARKVPEGAFRTFETGHRNCLGQNLALLEAKVVLALTCRRFEFELKLGEEERGRRERRWREGRQDVEGEELYQILVGAAKPREGMPVRVRRTDG